MAPFAVSLFEGESTFVEPDVTVVCDQGRFSDRVREGQDLVAEVTSPSSVRVDYFSKFSLY